MNTIFIIILVIIVAIIYVFYSKGFIKIGKTETPPAPVMQPQVQSPVRPVTPPNPNVVFRPRAVQNNLPSVESLEKQVDQNGRLRMRSEPIEPPKSAQPVEKNENEYSDIENLAKMEPPPAPGTQ